MARSAVLGALEALKPIVDVNERSYVVDLFFSAKYRELASIFEQSTVASQAFDLLAEMLGGAAQQLPA